MTRKRASRLAHLTGIGVDRAGDAADQLQDPSILRMENLDTDLPLPSGVIEASRQAIGRDDCNSYLPFLGMRQLRQEVAALQYRLTGIPYDWNSTTIMCADGMSGVLNVLLALVDPGDEVLLPDPVYSGLVNRVFLAGGIPIFVPCEKQGEIWKLNVSALANAISRRTKMFLMMSPVMPSGCVFSRNDWEILCEACLEADAWMLYDSAMERILFDNVEHIHPASFPGMAERTIIAGSVSKEYRMIGWRIGWVVAPPPVTNDIALVTIANAVCAGGIAQPGALAALQASDSDLSGAVMELQNRRDALLLELNGYDIVRPQGGWSLLMDISRLGISSAKAADRLLKMGKIAVTPMTGWGSKRANDFIRFVYSNEPVERLRGMRSRVDAALQ